MPHRAASSCPRCGMTVAKGKGYCSKHQAQRESDLAQMRAKTDRERGTTTQRGYGSRWQRLRKMILASEPLCRICNENGILRAANVVDHIDGNSFNNERENLRPLCKRCHDQRTARDQGFGRKKDGKSNAPR